MPPAAARIRPVVVGDRAGERAPHVAEQLALDQLVRDRRAVDRHELAGARRERAWRRRAATSLPVPVSPVSSTGIDVGAARSSSASTRARRRRCARRSPAGAAAGGDAAPRARRAGARACRRSSASSAHDVVRAGEHGRGRGDRIERRPRRAARSTARAGGCRAAARGADDDPQRGALRRDHRGARVASARRTGARRGAAPRSAMLACPSL